MKYQKKVIYFAIKIEVAGKIYICFIRYNKWTKNIPI